VTVATATVAVEPLTPARWPDLEALIGPNGVGGCWCMWWRQSAREFETLGGEPNRRSLKALVDQGRPTGLLAYEDGTPVGWVSVAPRADFGRLNRSPKLFPVDDEPVWSVVCFYVTPRRRGSGVASALLDAAVAAAAAAGAAVVEAYPIDPGEGRAASAGAYTGLLGMFLAAGFEEVVRRGGRPIVRRPTGA
jgi:GNAT superfamily N-acetyltransferase